MSGNSPTPPQTSETVRTDLFKYSFFSGRFTRSDFWLCKMIALLLFPIVFACVSAIDYCNVTGIQVTCCIVLLLYWLYNVWVEVKRLHDIGVSGALMLPVIAVGFFLTVQTSENVFEFNGYDVALSCIGLLWMLFLGIKDSQKGTNKYGSSIKYPDVTE